MSENKAPSGGENKKKEKPQLGAREIRRKKRVRSQIIAYVSLIIIVCGLAVGAIFGIRYLGKKLYNNKVEDKPVPESGQQDDYVPVISTPDKVETEGEDSPTDDLDTPDEEIVVETEDDLLNEVVQSCIAEMSLEDKVAGLFIVTPEQLTGVDKVVKAGDGTKTALETYPVGGIVYSKDNIQSGDQIKEMLANTVSYSRYPIFLAVEEELGDKTVLQSTLKLDATQSAPELGAAADKDAVYNAYSAVGLRLAEYGFNLDIAPSADIVGSEENTVVAETSFGGSPELVSDMIASSVTGLKDNGITACLKHFPGQGAADGDPNAGLASVSKSPDEFKTKDIIPFLTGAEAGADMIMVGNFMAPALTGDSTMVCSMSKAVMTELLRVENGYRGVIITDAFDAVPIKEYYGADEAAVKALRAGADMIYRPYDFKAAYEGVIAAVKDGTIDEQRINDSLARVYRIKYRSTVE